MGRKQRKSKENLPALEEVCTPIACHRHLAATVDATAVAPAVASSVAVADTAIAAAAAAATDAAAVAADSRPSP